MSSIALRFGGLAVAAAAALMTGCVTRTPDSGGPARAAAPSLWHDDDLEGLREAIARQCATTRPPPPWPQLCPEALAAGPRLRDWLDRRMRAAPLTDDDGKADGLVTGYYEIELTGSRRRTAPAQVPLYRKPPATVPGLPLSRERIERHPSLLAGNELVWIDDPVDAFFLHVQGAGRVRLRDGGEMRVGYAGDNGLAYRAIGATLVARGALAPGAVDAPAIRAWLRAHPDEARAVMWSNPRYVFFRELPPMAAGDSPPGSLGVPLTALRSVAVDPARIAPGSLLWVDTTWPSDGRPLRRLVLAQDTGAAIRGAVRLDLFFGRGETAARNAGAMKQRARVWVLRPDTP